MKPEAQRIAIAEACGWTAEQDGDGFWRATDGQGNYTSELWIGESNVWSVGIPDYLNDLNAMHDAEKVLKNYNSISGDSEFGRYITALQKITAWYRVPCATAAQRAEAFLRTMGRWEDHP